jgi:SET domain
MSQVVTREGIERLQAVLLQIPQAQIVTVHSFFPGTYERTVIIPPWTVLSGAAHKTAYRVRLEKGVIAVNTDQGIQVLEAPYEFDAPAGMQRIGRVFEHEVVWVDIYDNPDDCRDIAVLEERLYVVPDCGLGEHRRIEAQRQDYLTFVEQLGIPQERIDAMVATDDLIPMPPGFDVELRPSPIHGTGLFALRDFREGELICPGRIDGHRTAAGRFINHSPYPNATSVKTGDDISAVALRSIRKDEEILISYRTAVKVNFDWEIPCLLG